MPINQHLLDRSEEIPLWLAQHTPGQNPNIESFFPDARFSTRDLDWMASQ